MWLLVGVGSFAQVAIDVAGLLASQGIGATVVDPRWILPINKDLVEMSKDHRLVVTIEDGLKTGGFGSRVRQELRANEVDTALSEIGVPAEFLEHAERSEILERLGLTDKVNRKRHRLPRFSGQRSHTLRRLRMRMLSLS